MANLKHLSLICSIFVLSTISIMPQGGNCRVFQPNDVKLIEKTCKKTVDPTLCIKLLEADPHGSSADVRGLAVIMLNATKVKANDTMNKVNELLKGGGGGDKKALTSCADNYKAILERDVPQAIQALQSAGKLEVAELGASNSVIEAVACEQGFNHISPLFKDNLAVSDAAEVAWEIIKQLL